MVLEVSKQLNYYYKHKAERLLYQAFYYLKNKVTILINKHQRDQLKKVQRTKNNTSLIRNIMFRTHCDLLSEQKDNARLISESCFHVHGKPRKPRKYNIYQSHLAFHLKPELYWNPFLKRVQSKPWIFEKDCVSARELNFQVCHFLGLKLGDSIVWKEPNRLGVATSHILYFDRSGLDMSHKDDLEKLVNYAIETGLKGNELLGMFALKFSIDNYIQLFRGNKLLITSEPENALKSYLRQNISFKLIQQQDLSMINEELDLIEWELEDYYQDYENPLNWL